MVQPFKKIVGALLAVALLVVPQVAHADVNLLSGQKQYYTVQMRADKKTLVYAKVTFENSSTTDELKNFTFTLPEKVNVTSLGVQQILAKDNDASCKIYETYDQYVQRVGYNAAYDFPRGKKCLENAPPAYDDDYDFDADMSSSTDYYYYSYYLKPDTKFEYVDVKPQVKGQQYTLELSHPIKPKKQGAILVSYITDSYITGAMGRYRYDFRTFTADQLVTRAVVAINFDDELYSRLPKTSRQQTSATNGSSLAQGVSLDSSANYSSKNIDNIQLGVGSGGRYVETKDQLLPGETFSVKGTFATSRLGLFLPQIFWGLAGLLAVAAGVIFGIRWYRRRHPRTGRKTAAAMSTPVKKSFAALEPETSQTLSIRRSLAISLIAIGSTALLVLALVGVNALTRTGNYYSNFDAVFQQIAAVVSVIFVLAAAFVLPAIFVLRYGVHTLFKWLVIHLLLVFVVFLVAACVYALTNLGDTNNSDRIYPMSGSTTIQ